MKQETLFDLNVHYKEDGTLSGYSVTPITVIRRSILPGCTKESITAIDANGIKFNGSPENYFETENEAWERIEKDLFEALKNNFERASYLLKEALIWQNVLIEVTKKIHR